MSQAKPENEDMKNMTKRARARLEQQALQAHDIKNLTKLGSKGQGTSDGQVGQQGHQGTGDCRGKEEAGGQEERELKKDARRAKREAKLKDKSAEKLISNSIVCLTGQVNDVRDGDW